MKRRGDHSFRSSAIPSSTDFREVRSVWDLDRCPVAHDSGSLVAKLSMPSAEER
jgi:hypothetical protein